MKSLKQYIKECVSTPVNTMGVGNPCIQGDMMSEPIVTSKKKKPTKNSRLLSVSKI